MARAYLAERLATPDSMKTARDYGSHADDIRMELSAGLGELLDPDDDDHARNLVLREARELLAQRRYPIGRDQRPDENFLNLIRRAVIASHSIEMRRLDQDFTDDPGDVIFANFRDAAYPTPLSGSKRLNLREAIEKFWADDLTVDPKAAKTLVKYRASLDLLAGVLGADTMLRQVTKDHLLSYRDLISRLPPNFTKKFKNNLTLDEIAADATRRQIEPMKYKTQELHIMLMSRFFRWAEKNDYVAKSYAADIRPRARRIPDAQKRRSFTIAELNRIFSAPVFVGCKDDGRGYATPGDAVIKRSRYWAPLIALYTGMRMGEILQLRVSNVRESGAGTHFFFLTEDLAEDDGDHDFDGMQLKTYASRREVPIHSVLVQAGFLNFVSDAKSRGRLELFPEVPTAADGKKSTIFSKRFSRFLQKAGVKPDGSGNCFHMFRHTLRDALRRGRVPEEVADAVQGWSRDQNTGRSYGEGFEADTLVDDWERVSFPGLDISHLKI